MEFKKYDGYIKWEKIYFSYNEVKDREDLPDWYKEFAAHIGNKYKNNDKATKMSLIILKIMHLR